MSKIDLGDREKRERYLRCLVSGFIILLLIQGVLMLSLSSWTLSRQIFACTFLHQYQVPVYLDLIVGAAVTILGLFGAYNNILRGGNLQFVRRFLWIFISVLIVEICCAVLIGHDAAAIQDGDLLKILKKSQGEYLLNDTEEQKCWDTLQMNFKCCGIHNMSDWSRPLPPKTCLCDANSLSAKENCGFQGPGEYQVYKLGCYDLLHEEMKRDFSMLIALNVICTVVQILQVFGSAYCVMKIQNPLTVHVT
ncbi:tetraspanin-4-like [Lingula anatina]|uniref:Tetraspanin-4-like n=1 Tax=Lingula anatina TaxID=7574 RepID=A0A1S3HVM0_LINAN|nr:tetraspanin-4-like [Lingula anatina]|eukprot:XP_013390087.1 tetraspanin-4-like [Lingula anatina]